MTQRTSVLAFVCRIILVVGLVGIPSCHGFVLIQSTQALTRSLHSAHAYYSRLTPNHRRYPCSRKSSTQIQVKSPRKSSSKNNDSPNFQVPSPDALLIDALAILLAVELIGLIADVTDADFLRKGGWFQPLPTIEEQGSAINKVLVGWFLNVTLWTTTLTLTPVIVGKNALKSSANPWTSRFVPSLLVFALLRISYAIALASLTGYDIAWEAVLQDVYIVGLLLGTARYVLGFD